MDKNYSIAFSHALLAGTSFWVIYRVNALNYATASFGIIGINSAINVWKYGNPDYGHKIDDIAEHTDLGSTLFATAGVNTNLYLHYGFEWMYAILHMIIPGIPMTMSLLGERVDYQFVDGCNAANAISMGYISFTHSNDFGMYAAFCHLVNHFLLKKKSLGDVPREVVFNVGMCFYVYFAYKAICSSYNNPLWVVLLRCSRSKSRASSLLLLFDLFVNWGLINYFPFALLYCFKFFECKLLKNLCTKNVFKLRGHSGSGCLSSCMCIGVCEALQFIMKYRNGKTYFQTTGWIYQIIRKSNLSNKLVDVVQEFRHHAPKISAGFVEYIETLFY